MVLASESVNFGIEVRNDCGENGRETSRQSIVILGLGRFYIDICIGIVIIIMAIDRRVPQLVFCGNQLLLLLL